MTNPVLSRFDVTLYKNKAATDSAQVPWAGARIDCYLQGATVNQSSAIPTGSSTVVIYDPGQLTAGCTVQVDVAGPALAVTAINSPTQITVSNTTGSSISISPGTRLILISSRPTIYTDPLGKTPVPGGNYVIADGNGRVAAYIAQSRFDYVATDAVRVDATSSATRTGTGSSLTWQHTNNGPNALVLVAIAWQETLGEETLNSVTYRGQSMTLLAAGGYANLYYVIPANLGQQTIEVTWSGTNAKGAVGGAVSLTGVNQTTPLGTVASVDGSSANPSASVSGTNAMGLVFGALGVNALASFVTITPNGQIQGWSDSAGTYATLTQTQGAGGTKPGNGGAVASTWTLGSSRSWTVIAIEAKPVTITVPVTRLAVDAVGGTAPSPSWINAKDWPGLQYAVDAVPAGGTLFIPAGDYTVPSGGLVISKPMEIAGAGNRTGGTILHPFNGDAANQPVIKTAKGNSYGETLAGIYIHDLAIVGAATAVRSGSHGIFVDTDTDQKVHYLQIERVGVGGMGGSGFYINGYDGGDGAVIGFTLANCYSSLNRGYGLYVHGATLVETRSNLFIGNHNLGGFFDNLNAFASTGDYYEGNCLDNTIAASLGQLYLASCVFSLQGINFEDFNTASQPSCKRACALVNSTGFIGGCKFINSAEPSSPTDAEKVGALYIDNSLGGSILSAPHTFQFCYTAIECHDGAAGTTVMPYTKGAGTNGELKRGAGTAILQVAATNMLTPSSAAEGQLLWDKTNKVFKVWDGSAWKTWTLV